VASNNIFVLGLSKWLPGYMGGKVKVEIFDDQVWTMTVWEDVQKLLETKKYDDHKPF